MYYDPHGPLHSSRSSLPPFHVHVANGGETGSITSPALFCISSLYFCDNCSRLVSRTDLAEDVDSYYCPHCLENMPSSEAMLCGMRCSKCWECPVCSSTLTPCIANPSSKEQTYHFACSFCRWSSRGRQEAEKPEQLITQIVALERESEPRQRMVAMVDAFRTKAQDQQRERELAQRLKRRSLTRTSFSSASLTAFAARRFSSAVSMRGSTRLSAIGGSVLSLGAGELGKKIISGPWSIEDLEAKLAEQEEKQKDLRTNASLAATSALDSPEPSMDAGAKDSPSRQFSFSGHATSSEVPVLAGLSAQDLLRAHREPFSKTPESNLLSEMQSSIEIDANIGCGTASDCASLGMRLLQVSYGYHGVPYDVTKQPAQSLRRGQSQLEAPLQHRHPWKLLPVRKPLLTKRSRRCKLLHAATESEPIKVCKGLVVKPKINPCANPPFQKNSVAATIVPRIIPWSCGSGPDGEMNIVVIMANTMETDLVLEFDPAAFNERSASSKAGFTSQPWRALLANQTVEVLTPAFSTTIPKSLDEAPEGFEEDAKKYRATDNPDIILQRKMNKIFVRLRFQKEPAVNCWVFFAHVRLKFAVSFSDTDMKNHEVDVVLRFGSQSSEGTQLLPHSQLSSSTLVS